jgi:iron(III) transport system substrate-binding protein
MKKSHQKGGIMTFRMIRKQVLGSLAAGALLLVAANPARAVDPKLVAAAKKEGEVVWYTTLIVNQLVRPMVAAFEKKYGVKVRFTRANSTVTTTRVLSEAKAGHVIGDVHDGTDGVETLKHAGLIEHWMPDNWRDYPPEYRDPDGYWIATNLYFLTPGVNTQMVPAKDRPRTYEDLLDPRWKGKMAWAATSTSSGAQGFIGNILISMGQEKGMAYLQKLAKQKIINAAGSARQVLDGAIAGEYPIALQIFNHHTVISAKKGAPITWIKMQPVPSTLNTIAVVKGAPHPNAAKLLISYMVSPEGQRVFQKAGYLPANPDVPAATPDLKPREGHFKANVLSQKLLDKELPKWAKIFNELFR